MKNILHYISDDLGVEPVHANNRGWLFDELLALRELEFYVGLSEIHWEIWPIRWIEA